MKKTTVALLIVSMLIAAFGLVGCAAKEAPSSEKTDRLGNISENTGEILWIDGTPYVVYTYTDAFTATLSEEELNVPTKDLVELIIRHPRTTGLRVADSPEIDTYASLRDSFNAIPELESRADAVSVMFDTLMKLANADEKEKTIAGINLYTLLGVPFYNSQMTEEQKAQVKSVQNQFFVPASNSSAQ